MADPVPEQQVYGVDGDRLTSDEQVTAALESGRIAFQPGTRVNMVRPDGSIGSVRAEKAFDALRQGYRVEGFSEARSRAYKEQHGGDLGEQALVFAENVVSSTPIAGAVYDVIAAKAGGPEYTEARRLREEAHVGVRTAGEVGSLAIPFAGELGLLGRVGKIAAAPTRALGAVGGAAERIAARAVGTGATSTAGKIGQLGARYAARGAAEGAVYGAQQAISEAALGDQELTAEMLWAGAKHGAFLGAVVGGGVGIAGAAGKAAAPALRRSGLAQTFKGLTGATGSDIRKLAAQPGAEKLRKSVEQIEATMGPNAIGALDTLPKIQKKVAAEVEKAGAELGVIRKGLDEVAEMRPVARQAATNILKAADDQLGALRGGLAGEGIRVARGVERDYLAGLRESVADLGVTRRATGEVIERAPTFRQLTELRKRVQAGGEWGSLAPSPKALEARKLQHTIEQEIEGAIEQSGGAMGAEKLATYQAAKQRYGGLKDADDVLHSRVSMSEGNRALSLTDAVMGAGGFAVAGDPVTAIAAATANKLLRSSVATRLGGKLMRGAADMLDRFGSAVAVRDAVSSRIASEARAAVRGPQALPAGRPARTAAAVEQRRVESLSQVPTRATLEFDQRQRQTRAAVANRAGSLDRINARLAQFADVAPGTAGRMASVAMRAQDYLATKMPRSYAPPTITGQPQGVPSEADKQDFLRRWHAVQNPTSALELLREGRLDQSTVDAIQAVYPRMYDRMRSEVVQAVSKSAQRGDQVPYQQVLQLGRLFKVPLDYTARPQFAAAMQSMYAQPPAPSTPAAAQRMPQSRAASQIGQRRMTRLEEMEAT